MLYFGTHSVSLRTFLKIIWEGVWKHSPEQHFDSSPAAFYDLFQIVLLATWGRLSVVQMVTMAEKNAECTIKNKRKRWRLWNFISVLSMKCDALPYRTVHFLHLLGLFYYITQHPISCTSPFWCWLWLEAERLSLKMPATQASFIFFFFFSFQMPLGIM